MVNNGKSPHRNVGIFFYLKTCVFQKNAVILYKIQNILWKINQNY